MMETLRLYETTTAWYAQVKTEFGILDLKARKEKGAESPKPEFWLSLAADCVVAAAEVESKGVAPCPMCGYLSPEIK